MTTYFYFKDLEETSKTMADISDQIAGKSIYTGLEKHENRQAKVEQVFERLYDMNGSGDIWATLTI